jgi:multidrug efflux system outer membrane protein
MLPNDFRSSIRTALRVAMLLALTACTVGPKYVKPEVALPPAFDQAPAAVTTGENESALWSAFNDPALNALLARAQQENKTIAQAAARLRETRALRGLSVYSLFPTITAGADAEKSRSSNLDPFIPAGTGITESYRAGFDSSWEIDLFGSLRQQKNAIVRQSLADGFALDAARLAVNAEVAQAYFAAQGARLRLKVQQETIANLQETDRILAARQREGRGSGLELAQNRALALQATAQVPGIEADIVRHQQRLAVLSVQPVAAVQTLLAQSPGLPELPALKTVGTPAEWLARRPDVHAAEQRFAAANARVGVEMAEYFPKLTLLGGFGWTAQSAGTLGDSTGQRWRYGPSISWSFLNVGRVRQNVKAAEARADASAAAYQESVLLALEDTENALAQYRASNQSAQQLAQAAVQSRRARDLAKLRYDAGATDFLTLLDAERSLLTVQDALAQAETARATALALLYKSLAGDFAQKAPDAT